MYTFIGHAFLHDFFCSVVVRGQVTEKDAGEFRMLTVFIVQIIDDGIDRFCCHHRPPQRDFCREVRQQTECQHRYLLVPISD